MNSLKLLSLSALLSLLYLFPGNMVNAQEGIQFFEGSFDEALAEAKNSNKLIFLDAYASWCGPCKMMAAEIFPLEDVGNFYNDNFINVKMDMEKGEGPGLAEKYSVQFYPTYLYIGSDGNAVHQGAGYKPGEDFIEDGKNAMNPDRQVFTLLERYEKDPEDSKVSRNLALSAYGANLFDLMESATASYVSSLSESDWAKPDAMDFVMQTLSTGFGSPSFDRFVKDQDKYIERYGKEEVHGSLQEVLLRDIISASHAKDDNRVQDILDFVKKNMPEYAEEINPMLNLQYYQRSQQWDKYADLASTHYGKGKHIDDWQELNATAWTFYEQVEDKGHIAQAAQWAKRSIKLDKNYYNTDTYAALLYKMGRLKKAKKWAKTAISLAEAQDMEPTDTKRLLRRIEKELK